MDPDQVDLPRGDGDERDRLGISEYGLSEALELGRTLDDKLRVVQLSEFTQARAGGEPVQVEENARGHDRTGDGAAPRLVHASDQANAARAVVDEEGRFAHRASYSIPPRESELT